ncbi:MAG: hypothetical protein AABX83_04305 [Nanoarchaeota archaeon]
MTAKRGQSAIELFILIGAVMFFFVVFLFAIESQSADKTREHLNLAGRDIALSVQDEIIFASQSSNGYMREFDVPSKMDGGVDYDINLVDGFVYLKSADGRYALALPVLNITGNVNKGKNIIQKQNGMVYLNS